MARIKKPSSYALRQVTVGKPKAEWPIVYRAKTLAKINAYCESTGWKFKKDGSLYGGYYYDADGESFLLDDGSFKYFTTDIYGKERTQRNPGKRAGKNPGKAGRGLSDYRRKTLLMEKKRTLGWFLKRADFFSNSKAKAKKEYAEYLLDYEEAKKHPIKKECGLNPKGFYLFIGHDDDEETRKRADRLEITKKFPYEWMRIYGGEVVFTGSGYLATWQVHGKEMACFEFRTDHSRTVAINAMKKDKDIASVWNTVDVGNSAHKFSGAALNPGEEIVAVADMKPKGKGKKNPCGKKRKAKKNPYKPWRGRLTAAQLAEKQLFDKQMWRVGVDDVPEKSKLRHYKEYKASGLTMREYLKKWWGKYA